MPVVTPLLPFGVNNSVWLTSVFLLCSVAPMPAAGRMGDAYGQRRMFLVGLAVTAAALLLGAASWSFGALVFARALQGIGVALFLPQAFGLIPRVLPPERHGRAFAVWGIVGSIASLLGPVLGGAIAQAQGWRAGFALQAVLCLIALAATAAWVPRLPASGARVPLVPVLLSLAGLGALVYGIQFGNWVGVLVGAISLAALLIAARTGEDQGFLPLHLFRERTFALGTVGVTTMGFAAASMFIPLMYWLQTAAGASPSTAGLIAAPMSVLALVATPVAGHLTDTADPRMLCITGFCVQAAGLALAAGLILLGAAPGWFAIATALLGLGSACVWAPNAAITMRRIPPSDAGAASGLYNTVRQVGSVVGVALVGAVLAAGKIEDTAAFALALPLGAFVVGGVSAAFLGPIPAGGASTASGHASR